VTRPTVWIEDAPSEIDFCVWALIADGLRVPPFDVHPPGSGELQAAGLTAPEWQGWFRRVVTAQWALSQEVRAAGDLSRLTPGDRAALAHHLDAARPAAAWAGAEAVRERLGPLWATYEPEGEAWRRQVSDSNGPFDLSPRERGRLWRAVDHDRHAGRTLVTYLVRYPAPVVDVHVPDMLVVALGHERTVDAYMRLLRAGIARLEGRNGPDETSTSRATR
jgi:hypothetical protein